MDPLTRNNILAKRTQLRGTMIFIHEERENHKVLEKTMRKGRADGKKLVINRNKLNTICDTPEVAEKQRWTVPKVLAQEKPNQSKYGGHYFHEVQRQTGRM